MTLQVIVGGQYGSEGKGAIAAYLAAEQRDLLAVRVAGSNAGHTVIGRCPPACEEGFQGTEMGGSHPADCHPWRLRHVPVAAVANEEALLAIAPGSEIDPDVLTSEVFALNSAGYDVSDRLWVDETATLIDPVHHEVENGYATGVFLGEGEPGSTLVGRIGSTGKGVGAARAARAMREARLADEYDWADRIYDPADVGERIRERLRHFGNVQIEGTQGYLLGQHAGFYPHCTSSDCTAMDFMAMAGAPAWLVPSDHLQVWVVFRTYPIRVAGNSGPLPGETSWAALGQEPEFTTVTRKERRVGSWDAILSRRAAEANGSRPGPHNPVRVALTMCDYVVPGISGLNYLGSAEGHDLDLFDQLISRTSKDLGTLVRLAGTGPSSVIDLRHNGYRETGSLERQLII